MNLRCRPLRRSLFLFTSALLCVFAVVSVSKGASAQLGVPKFRIKGGIYLPQNTALKSLSSDVWVKVGGDVDLPISLLPLLKTRLGIEYAFSGGNRMVPITISEIFQPSVAIHNPVYLGAGIGLWAQDLSGIRSSAKFGFRILGGIEVSDKLFFELEYDFVSHNSGTRADGPSLLIGTKF